MTGMFSLITEVAPKRLTSLVKSTFIKKKAANGSITDSAAGNRIVIRSLKD